MEKFDIGGFLTFGDELLITERTVKILWIYINKYIHQMKCFIYIQE